MIAGWHEQVFGGLAATARRFGSIAILALALVFALAAVVHAQGARTALVVGNGAYSFAPLANPANDAGDVAKSLREAGFDVRLVLDADRAGMIEAARELGDRLKKSGGVGLFYFAGHGVQVAGENHLLAISEGISAASDLADKAVSAAEIVDIMSAAGNDLNIVILDACRDNPLTGGTNGLSRIDSSASLFVSYSTSPGAVALDGEGRNSPYAKHLTLSLATPNLNLEETFKRTLKGVYQETHGQQTPWLSSSFFGEFVFRGEGSQSAREPAGAAQSGGGQEAQRAASLRLPDAVAAIPRITGVYRVNGTNPDGSRYKGMVALAQEGERFDVTWWIGKQVFHGTGELAGRMLVVDWNSTAPVVYTFKPGSVLDGEWADGTATERLVLFGEPASGDAPRPGRYRVAGRNPDGSRYSGTLTLARSGDEYELKWSIGNSGYSGQGRLENGLLVVEWGGATPVVYAPDGDGGLRGLWDAGAGEEVLTPRG